MAIAILNQSVVDLNTVASAYTVTGFNVPPGTSRLLMLIEYYGASTTAPPVTSVTHNADAVSELFTNAAVGNSHINTWWGQRQNPDIGTFDIVITYPSSARGAKVWLLALDGEKSSGSILGAIDSQRIDTNTATVGLGITPTSTGSLLLASLAMANQDQTLISWTGTGFTEVTGGTGIFGANNGMPSTSRYRLNAPSSVITVSGTFSDATTNIGGSLIEILAEASGVDVSGDIAFGLAITGTAGVAAGASARIDDASYRSGKSSWTEILLLQPDVAGVDRRIISAGPAFAPNYTLDMIQTGAAAINVYRWRYRLADGLVTVETSAGSQTTAAHVIALVHSPGDPTAYVNGFASVSSRTGNLRVGVSDIGAGGLAIGGHDEASPAAYTGLIGRYLLYGGAMTEQQVRLLSMSLLDPDSLWGQGSSENDAQVVNRSPVAMPALVEPDGRPSMTITPRTVDPDGTQPTITSVNQGAYTTVAISGTAQLLLTFEPGWQGFDAFHYTIGDGFKFSTAKISIEQRRPALLARNDAITVAADGSILFDPRANDVGAGTLRVVSVSDPPGGTAVVQADGRILYTPDP